MNISKSTWRIDRRRFLSGAVTLGAAATILTPLKTHGQNGRRKVSWDGFSIMRACPEAGCSALRDYFPNVYPLLEDPQKNLILLNKMDALFTDSNKINDEIEIVWPNPSNNYGADIDSDNIDLGMFVGITADREIADDYKKQDNTTTFIFALQCYVVTFNMNSFEVFNSFPIRIMYVDHLKGKKTKEIQKLKMWNILSGEHENRATNKNQPLTPYMDGTIPGEMKTKIDNLKFNKIKPLNIRVTDIELRKHAKKWIINQDKTEEEFKVITGNSLTTAVSEKANISIQPYSPNQALTSLTRNMVSGAGKSAKEYTKLYQLQPIEMDLRLSVKGMRVTDKKVEGYKTIKDRTILIITTLTAGKWKRTKDRPDLDEQLEQYFHQNLRVISVERTSGVWSNNWYWVVDLHQYLFNWFFEEIVKGDNYSKMKRGHQRRGKSRKFLTQVLTKDFEAFEKEAKIFRRKLLGL